MIYYTANAVVTPDSLLEAIQNSYNGCVRLQEEKQLEKRHVVNVIEIFKEDCDYVKSLLIRNYEKAEVDKFKQLADELIEKVNNDPEEYLIDGIRRTHPDRMKELNSLLEQQINKN